jgi:hypothetical protein
MNRKAKKIAVIVPLALLLILFLLVLAADAWLESSHGKNRLSAALTDGLGMPVRLQGEFDIVLFPSVGVTGTDLFVGDSATAPFIRSGSYHASLALLPLIDGQLDILAFSAADGSIDPGQFRKSDTDSPKASRAAFRLPEVTQMQLENFMLFLPSGEKGSLLIDHLELREFQAGVKSPLSLALTLLSGQTALASLEALSSLTVDENLDWISLDLEELKLQLDSLILEGISGQMSWQPGQEFLQADLSWSGLSPQSAGTDSARLSFNLSSETLAGSIELEYLQAGQDEVLEAALEFRPAEQGIAIPLAGISFAGMNVSGSGCLLTREEPSLHLKMSSRRIDVERLESLLPGDTGAGTGFGGDDFPIDLNLTLSVQEILAAGATVREAELSIGGRPDCSLLQD